MSKVVIIWHNVQLSDGLPVGMLEGYQPGHAMTPVFTYVTESPDPVNEAYELFNAPEDYLAPEKRPIQRRYYANRLRSLSTGDVIQVNGQAMAVARFGWEDLPAGSLRVTANPFDHFTDES